MAWRTDECPLGNVRPGPRYHVAAGNIVLAVAILAFALAACVYYWNLLDPADAEEQFPGVYNFLANKWYFDAAYSVLLVRPALAVAHWCTHVRHQHHRRRSSMAQPR